MDYCGLSCAAFLKGKGVGGSREACLRGKNKIMSSTSENNKRIAKNTIALYFRMLLTIVVSLYTSRVVLNALGVEDYGIYNVVGGVVAMFNILSGSLSSAISRFITFELGKNDLEKLKVVFSSSVTIQIILAVAITIIAEIAGIWFINEKMNIAADRLIAANWVFHFSILTFAVNLISVPYNAAIVAHEKMSAFAYISILETVGKLLVAYLIMISPIDKLIFYGLLMLLVALLVRFSYTYYCKRNFEECSYHFIWDKQLIKQMFGFAGWNFIGSSSAVLRDQGGNILLNLFFGATVNAARGIAYQVFTAIYSFATNFMTALNPQITKSYAAGNYDYMMNLVFKGSRFASYLLFMMSLPVFINTGYILNFWLDTVPEKTEIFVRLILIFAMSEVISRPLVTAQLSTGNIRNYQLVVGGIQLLNLPLSYFVFKCNGDAESLFIVSILVSQLCFVSRLFMLKKIIRFFSIRRFLKEVYLNIAFVFIISAIIPIYTASILNDNLIGFLISSFTSVISSAVTVYFIGCSKSERIYILDKINSIKTRIIHDNK